MVPGDAGYSGRCRMPPLLIEQEGIKLKGGWLQAESAKRRSCGSGSIAGGAPGSLALRSM
jgi:hypothetical protein